MQIEIYNMFMVFVCLLIGQELHFSIELDNGSTCRILCIIVPVYMKPG
jgi:hypothetical protein